MKIDYSIGQKEISYESETLQNTLLYVPTCRKWQNEEIKWYHGSQINTSSPQIFFLIKYNIIMLCQIINNDYSLHP